MAIGVQLGVVPEQIAAGLSVSRVDRRFQIKGTVRVMSTITGIIRIEINAMPAAARECGHGRVLVLFQPHRYTRHET